MGHFKEQMMDKKNQDDNELVDFLSRLLEKGELEGAINGIAKQVTTQGVRSMSEKQRKTVDNFVESYKRKHQCNQCLGGNISILTDYIEVADSGLCPTCKYDKDKFMME